MENIGFGKLEKTKKEGLDDQNAHAEYFSFAKENLIVGIIAPFSKSWPCTKATCNRIRIGPNGAVNSCIESPHYNLKGKSFEEKRDLLNMVIYQKFIRILNDTWPAIHRTDYLKYRFGLES